VFGVEVALADLFDQPTIAVFGVVINRARLGLDKETGEFEEFEF
jgi:hypothetical protein